MRSYFSCSVCRFSSVPARAVIAAAVTVFVWFAFPSLMYYIQSVLMLQSKEMHVRGHALPGSLLQLEAAAKACRMELQGASLNSR